MPRRMSATSRAVLMQLEASPKTIDELAQRTGLEKVRLAYMLRDLGKLGWVTVTAVLRKKRWRVRVYGLARRVPVAAKIQRGIVTAPAPHIAALHAAFRIGLPSSRLRARRVRGAR